MDGPWKGSPEGPALDEPPMERDSALLLVGLGGGLMLVTMLTNLATSLVPVLDRVSGVAVIALAVGAVLIGKALAARPRDPLLWLASLASVFAGRFGVPDQFDSYRVVMNVLTLGALLGFVLASMPLRAALTLGSLLPFVHFLGIFSAVTSPSPQPWLGGQLWNRVYRPYLQLAYMNNAYQFYSPDPGPACQLWFCVTYGPEGAEAIDEPANKDFSADFNESELGTKPAGEAKKAETAWHKLPIRPEQYLDPLGQTYYRRLSITEQTMAQPPANYAANPRDVVESTSAREAVRTIAYHPEIPVANQYRQPNDQISRFVMPSYIRHVAHIMARPGKSIQSIKAYRVVHRIVPIEAIAGQPASETYGMPAIVPTAAYDPIMFLPYYQGDFHADGRLINPNDPMLYWLVPILYKNGDFTDPASRPKPRDAEHLSKEQYDRYYIDYVNIQTGSDHTAKEVAK